MPEQKKYEKLEGMPEADIVTFGNHALAVYVEGQKRLEDQAVFVNLSLVAGYNGNLGFTPNRFQAKIQIPVQNLNEEAWDKVNAAVKKQMQELEKIGIKGL